MKSFGASVVILGFAAATFAACGSEKKNEPPKNAMAQLTPEEQRAAQERATQQQETERQRELAASRDQPAPGGPPPNVNRTSTALAASSVSTAQCDRELRCKNIGTNKKYLTTEECVTKLQNDKRTSINPEACPQGVNENHLADCLKAIREEDCGNPLDSVTRLTQCRSGTLCLK